MYLLWKNVYSGLLPIFNVSFCFVLYWIVGAVYVLWILILYLIYHLQIFFCYFIICLIFSMVYLVVQMFLSLVRFHLFIFALISYTDQKRKKKKKQTNKKNSCYYLCQRVFCLFHSRGFLASALIVTSIVIIVIYFLWPHGPQNARFLCCCC